MATLNTDITLIDTFESARALGTDYVMRFDVWCKLAGISLSTGKRRVKAGKGPRITWMAPHRKGVRVSHHHEWLDACSNNNAKNETLADG